MLGVQLKAAAQPAAPRAADEVSRVAAAGVSGVGADMPYRSQIVASFGPEHDLSGIRAHVGGAATEACDELGAIAFATGEDIAFRGAPDLHTAAHEAAHIVQQRQGVQLYGGLSSADDLYERQADAVADRVVAGQSAADLLGGVSAGGAGPSAGVQRKAAGIDATRSKSDSARRTEPNANDAQDKSMDAAFGVMRVLQAANNVFIARAKGLELLQEQASIKDEENGTGIVELLLGCVLQAISGGTASMIMSVLQAEAKLGKLVADAIEGTTSTVIEEAVRESLATKTPTMHPVLAFAGAQHDALLEAHARLSDFILEKGPQWARQAKIDPDGTMDQLDAMAEALNLQRGTARVKQYDLSLQQWCVYLAQTTLGSIGPDGKNVPPAAPTGAKLRSTDMRQAVRAEDEVGVREQRKEDVVQGVLELSVVGYDPHLPVWIKTAQIRGLNASLRKDLETVAIGKLAIPIRVAAHLHARGNDPWVGRPTMLGRNEAGEYFFDAPMGEVSALHFLHDKAEPADEEFSDRAEQIEHWESKALEGVRAVFEQDLNHLNVLHGRENETITDDHDMVHIEG